MGRLVIEGECFFELEEGDSPHEYTVGAKHGQLATHSEYGDVQIYHSEQRGWHYVRLGYTGYGKDWNNLKPCRRRRAALASRRITNSHSRTGRNVGAMAPTWKPGRSSQPGMGAVAATLIRLLKYPTPMRGTLL